MENAKVGGRENMKMEDGVARENADAETTEAVDSLFNTVPIMSNKNNRP
jgi:hypothetical protein